MKHETLKSMRSNPSYLKSFLNHGNKKLTDYATDTISFKYAQFNQPARTTCPYKTRDCNKFCYAKRDERFPSAKNNRLQSFQDSKRSDFTERLIYTINAEMKSKRYSNSVMILRLHESGDFYNLDYLNKWIDTIGYYLNNTEYSNRIIFQAYTKSFVYFLAVAASDPFRYHTVIKAMEKGLFALSLSYDKSMGLKQLSELLKVKKLYPLANIYAAIKETDLASYNHDKKCDCADCAKCGLCTKTDGKTVAVVIH